MIAMLANVCQIVGGSRTAVLTGDDVVDCELLGDPQHWHKAVLAQKIRPLANELPECLIHEPYRWCPVVIVVPVIAKQKGQALP